MCQCERWLNFARKVVRLIKTGSLASARRENFDENLVYHLNITVINKEFKAKMISGPNLSSFEAKNLNLTEEVNSNFDYLFHRWLEYWTPDRQGYYNQLETSWQASFCCCCWCCWRFCILISMGHRISGGELHAPLIFTAHE